MKEIDVTDILKSYRDAHLATTTDITLKNKEINTRFAAQFKDLLLDQEDFLRELMILVNGEYNSPWSQVPKKYQDKFIEWVAEIKQQSWEGMYERGWAIYNREFIHAIIEEKINAIIN